MQIFVTGATGYIGGVVTERAIAEGHEVRGLSRTPEGDGKLQALGAMPVRADLTTLDVLRQENARADAVLHLAYIHDFTMDYEQVLRIDAAAVRALGEPLPGTDKPLLITSGTTVVEPDPAGAETTEEAPLAQSFVLNHRIRRNRPGDGCAAESIREVVITGVSTEVRD
jgi:nucleoside-diphosphate-sugar epimerase